MVNLWLHACIWISALIFYFVLGNSIMLNISSQHNLSNSDSSLLVRSFLMIFYSIWYSVSLVCFNSYLDCARGVMVTIVGNKLRFKSWMKQFAFRMTLIFLIKVWIQQFFLQQWVNSRADWTSLTLLEKSVLEKETLNSNLLNSV